MKAIIYLRVSTPRQAKEGLSLAAQAEKCREYCKRNEWRIIRSFRDEGISAFKRGNTLPQLAKAVDLACHRKATLVVYSLSRFGRSMIDSMTRLQRLTDEGASLASYSEGFDFGTTAGRLMLKIMLAFAEAESEQIGDRIRSVNDATVTRLGYRTQGRQPIGWKIVNGRRVPCEVERQLVARVQAVASTMSLRAAATHLEAAGVPTINELRGGAQKAWTARMVENLLTKTPDRRQGEELLG